MISTTNNMIAKIPTILSIQVEFSPSIAAMPDPEAGPSESPSWSAPVEVLHYILN